MKSFKLIARGTILRRQPEKPDARSTALPELCPAAKCGRCGYEFLPYTISAVCPRCLEPFTRDQCYGGCFSCPLLPHPPSDD
ncbi:MAG: hypothetical protein GWN66_13775 [Pseudomonas stutzeri]|nr:hypothetical protein [Stutzerimonas stutzeri]